ncbi:MAG: hypothetical protein E5X58_10270 [Mesorhizobium sp.]|nr:MAG: hypothetical protein E5X58_10270 [Mesorhizobium sp.]
MTFQQLNKIIIVDKNHGRSCTIQIGEIILRWPKAIIDPVLAVGIWVGTSIKIRTGRSSPTRALPERSRCDAFLL